MLTADDTRAAAGVYHYYSLPSLAPTPPIDPPWVEPPCYPWSFGFPRCLLSGWPTPPPPPSLPPLPHPPVVGAGVTRHMPVSARLTTATGEPVVGMTVRFETSGCRAAVKTDETGFARTTLQDCRARPEAIVEDSYTASFFGGFRIDETGTVGYRGSSDTAKVSLQVP